MSNERGSIWIAMEAILLLHYAWNSAPIPGTDLSRCFVALGQEFQFPINFSANKHWELTSTPATIKSYAREVAIHLQSSREIAKILVKEQQAWHHKFIHAYRPDPKIYSVGDIDFARQAVRSDASWGWVDKLPYPFTGPWQIVAKLLGTSYKIKHFSMKKTEKQHASDLSPYPPKLIPLQPLNDADNQYGQLHKQMSKNPYIQAGIKGFEPPMLFKVSAQFLTTDRSLDFSWSTLAKLNKDHFPYPWSFGKDFDANLTSNMEIVSQGFYTGPPPSAPKYSAPTIPPANVLAKQIMLVQIKFSSYRTLLAQATFESGAWCK